jgi:glycerol-3-phosphate dehydrogenase
LKQQPEKQRERRHETPPSSEDNVGGAENEQPAALAGFRERVLAFGRVKRDIAALVEREHDLLIVGGGIYGAAACWDAAQRGLRAALVEKADFGSGTSWNSLKTIHGGLRHLQRLELGLLRESVRERRALQRIAPALVRPLPFLLPTYGHGPRGREAMAVGLRLYDLLAWDRNDGLPEPDRIPRSRMLAASEVRERVPGIDAKGLTGGALWTEAQVLDSERLLLAFLRAASEAGALVANAVEATGLLRSGARVTGVSARDHESGDALALRARVVLNCAGPGAVGLLRRAGLERPRVPLLRAWNFVLRRAASPQLAVGGRGDGRYLFLVPWRGVSIVGTDYESADAPGDPKRQQRFLEAVQRAFPWAGISADDVALLHAGLVPGERDASGLWSHSLVTDHAEDGAPGLITAVGAKYTTARSVAERAVSLAFRNLGREAPPCRTAFTPLAWARPADAALERQVETAVREEMALTLADVVLRRAPLAGVGASGAEIETALAVTARERGWSSERADEERQALAHALRAHAPSLLYNPR